MTLFWGSRIGLPALCFALTLTGPLTGTLTGRVAFAQERGTREQALTLLDKAVALVQKVGPEKARPELSRADGGYIDRDLYVTVLDGTGIMMAHGTNPALNGKNLMALKDVDGKPFIREAIENAKAKGMGSVTYKWSDPITHQVAVKDMHYRQVGDFVVSVGVYQ